MSRYDDIINIPRWNPKSHPRMSEYDRAAQFAPFAALTGYDAMVCETARLTDARTDLDEEQMLALNETLSIIVERLNEHPKVSITWFRKDGRKKGGVYVQTEGTVRNVDIPGRLLILKEGAGISLDDIASIMILE
ncbi:MAG: YolD-like family protein [Bacteroidales bacterium]|nr:YolD-like family protein [Bacteroidales bacterium]